MTPLAFASLSILAADAESRLTSRSTFTPLLIIVCAMVAIWPASLLAFATVQVRLSFWHCALIASGSDVIHRLEDCVSGMNAPTFAPLPSMAPPAAELLALVAPPAGVVGVFFLLEEQALMASEAATPTTIRPTALLRMGSTAFRGRLTGQVRNPVDECCARQHIGRSHRPVSNSAVIETDSLPQRHAVAVRSRKMWRSAMGSGYCGRSERAQAKARRTYCMIPPCR